MSEKDSAKNDRSVLVALNPEYARKEKLIRMCAGCSSEPVSYKNGIIEIKVRLSKRIVEEEEFKTENVIRGLIKNWVGAIPAASGYRAHIYQSGLAEAGFCKPTSGIFKDDGEIDKDAIKQLADAIKAVMTAERIDVKIDEREETWSRKPLQGR